MADDDPWMNAEKATALGEKLLALMNDDPPGQPPAEDPPLGWEETAVKITAKFLSEDFDGLDPIMRQILPVWAGAYLGELLRRECGGQWVNPPPEAEEGPALVQFDNGLPCYPFDAVGRNIEGGARNSIHSFYRIMRALASLTKAELGDLAEGKLDFDKRFPDLAGAVTIGKANEKEPG